MSGSILKNLPMWKTLQNQEFDSLSAKEIPVALIVAGKMINAPIVVVTMVIAFSDPRRIMGLKLDILITENPKIRARDV